MRTAVRLTMSAAMLACILGVGSVRADLAPPSDYVEQCTIAKQQGRDMECVTCSATHSQACSVPGYTRQCTTRGASAWTEIWCRGGDGGPSANTGGGTGEGGAANTGGSAGTAGPPVVPEGGCSCSVFGGGARGIGWASLLGLALAWAGRRRRARKQ
jgi:MYXO-CTERM domain-containing protein